MENPGWGGGGENGRRQIFPLFWEEEEEEGQKKGRRVCGVKHVFDGSDTEEELLWTRRSLKKVGGEMGRDMSPLLSLFSSFPLPFPRTWDPDYKRRSIKRREIFPL